MKNSVFTEYMTELTRDYVQVLTIMKKRPSIILYKTYVCILHAIYKIKSWYLTF